MSFISKILKIMGIIQINDKTYNISNSSSVIIKGSKVIIDGIDCTPDLQNINVTVSGDIKSLFIGACNKLEVVGNVAEIDSSSGNITVTGSTGQIKTSSGDVRVKEHVTGKVETMSGDVTAGTIHGGVQTMSGDINTKTMSGNIKF